MEPCNALDRGTGGLRSSKDDFTLTIDNPTGIDYVPE